MVRYWPDGTDVRIMGRVQEGLASRFARFGVAGEDIPLATPATAGMWLLRASGAPLTALPLEQRELIVATAPQHRIEWLGSQAPTLPALYYYDGRGMYLGLIEMEIGQGPGQLTDGGALRPDARGRFAVEFTVPAHWAGPGLLPAARPAGGYEWPRQPGGSGFSWCSGAQARLAAAHGWPLVVRHHLSLSPGAPLRAWGGRLVTLYSWAQQEQGAEALAACYRAICLHTIGALHRTERKARLRTLDPAALAGVRPGDALEIDPDGSWAVQEKAYRLDRWAPELSHPEWSSGIWSAAQYRITRALLEAPPGSVLGVWGDAVYTTAPLTQVYREGDLGRLRLKRHVEGPLPAPHGWSELRELLQ